MLSLQLKDGEYLTIGEDIVVQVFTSSTIQVSVQAPKDMTILRGEVLERNGEKRPTCLYSQQSAKKNKAKKAENLRRERTEAPPSGEFSEHSSVSSG